MKEKVCLCKNLVNLLDIKEPFKLQNGWLLWAGVGLFGAIVSIALAGAAMTYLNGDIPDREVRQTDALLNSQIDCSCVLPYIS
jgi:hypothetical protein